jgi:Methylene-tetrahydrofolate reductase C terminal.
MGCEYRLQFICSRRVNSAARNLPGLGRSVDREAAHSRASAPGDPPGLPPAAGPAAPARLALAQRQDRGVRPGRPLFTTTERLTKDTLFGCRMCGQCALPVTGYVCPMGCPKELRNGPCGGVGADGGCEVYPERRCVWVEAFERAASQGRAPTCGCCTCPSTTAAGARARG